MSIGLGIGLRLTSSPLRSLAIENKSPPAVTLKALLDFGRNTDDGRLVRAVAVPWFQIMKTIQQNPANVYQIDWRRWEEIIAGAYTQAGFDEVILTPPSGDGGRDVIATKWGIGSIRFLIKSRRTSRPTW